jgi:hypothetical protein
MREWLDVRWELFKWRMFAGRYWARERALGLVLIGLGAALLVAMIVQPVWTLRYERAIAWQVVALSAILLFRRQLAALVQGRRFRRFNLGPGGFSGELEAEDQAEHAAIVPPEDLVEHEMVIVTLGTLAQLYQFQIDYLKHVAQSENMRLSNAATREWFRTKLAQGGAPDPDIDPLIQFLVDRDLIVLTDDDYYALTMNGQQFLDRISGFWYSPKGL